MRRILYAAALALISTPNAFAHDTPDEIIEQAYPQYNSKQRCLIAYSNGEHFCMRRAYDTVVHTPQGDYRLMLYRGKNYNLAEQRANDYHAASGRIGVFVFKQSAHGWQLADALPVSEPKGAWGEPPETWTLHEFGKGKWGFLGQDGYTGQGQTDSRYEIFLFDGKKVRNPNFAAGFSNVDAVFDPKQAVELAAKIKIDKQAAEINGFYPLRLTVHGSEAGKKLRPQTYTASYNPRTHNYQLPKNYPLH